MKEINKCLESGCRGGCCQNITIYDAEDVILKTFPKAIEVSVWKLAKAINGELTNGVYYQYDGRDPVPGMAIARIVGPCPNRLNNGNCKNYHSCSYAAENYKIDSPQCNLIRNNL
jgi:hypothetical protein